MSDPAPPLRRSLADVASVRPVVALGTFDGVHRGHRALLRRAAEVARELQRPWFPLAFFPPPKTLLTGHPFLSNEIEKHVLLHEAGVASGLAPSEIVILPFDARLAATTAQAFVAALAGLQPSAVVVGEDFRFGSRRGGKPQDLLACGARLEVLPLLAVGADVVKSSVIRNALESGDVERATDLLGAPYRVIGEVVVGNRRGRTIGVPTANVALDPRKALATGVFVVLADLPDGSRRGGMANLGPRPTFDDTTTSFEVHLFDWRGDLYGRPLSVHVLARLRDQQRFLGLESLQAQLRHDEAAARARLARAGASAR